MFKNRIVIFDKKQILVGNVSTNLLTYSDFEPSDYLDHLTDIETERVFSFTNVSRKREFVATRFLRHELFGFQHIHYDHFGAPFIENEGFISISHSSNIVGISCCNDFKIGLDIEIIRDKIIAIKHKFLSVEEIANMDCNSIIELTKIWSAKEVLYKISGRKGLNFRTELFLSKKNDEIWEGKIANKDHYLSTEIKITEFDDKIVAFNIKGFEKHAYNL